MLQMRNNNLIVRCVGISSVIPALRRIVFERKAPPFVFSTKIIQQQCDNTRGDTCESPENKESRINRVLENSPADRRRLESVSSTLLGYGFG
jgi:hypothetical protein